MADPVQNSTVIAPLTGTEQIFEKILHLRAALQQSSPNYEGILHTIHRELARSPDTVHFLSDEQISIIVSGLSKKTNVIIAEKESKAAKKNLKGTKLDDL